MSKTKSRLPQILSSDELGLLIMSMATVRGDKGFTEAEAKSLYTACECHLMMADCIRLAIKGQLMVDVDTDGELRIIHPLRVAEMQN